MTAKKDYIPRNVEAFEGFFKNIAQYTAQKCSGNNPEWDHIPKKAQEALAAAYGAWYTAYAPTLKPHTPPETAERNRAKKTAEKALREFVNRFLRCEPVSDKDRDILGVPNRSGSRAAHIDVNEMASFAFRLKEIRQVWVDFRVEGASGRAKPSGYDGAVIKWDVLDKPPARPEDLARGVKANRSPYALSFDETERGKTVYVAIAWQNGRGILGRWSAVQSTVIP